MKIGVKNKIVFLTVLSSIVIGNIYTSKINSNNNNPQEKNNSDIIQYQVDLETAQYPYYPRKYGHQVKTSRHQS